MDRFVESIRRQLDRVRDVEGFVVRIVAGGVALVAGGQPRDIATAANAGLDAASLVRDESPGTDPIALDEEQNVEPVHVLSSLAELERLP